MKRRSTITLVLLCIACLLTGCANLRSGAGWVTLFDGTSLANWDKTGESNWRLEEGAAVADQGNKAPSYLVSKNSYADFELKVEFWVDAVANSGVFFRCLDPARVGAATCYEAQIADSRTDGTGTGALTDLSKVLPPVTAAGRWNSFEITARGTQLTVALNGVVTARAESNRHSRGPIALQHVAGIVKFRRVEIRVL